VGDGDRGRVCPASGRAVNRKSGEERLPVIRLLGLRRIHATLLLADGVPVKVVSERLGHASATITLTV
jgi:integrase